LDTAQKTIDNSLDKGALPSGYQYILERMFSIYTKSLQGMWISKTSPGFVATAISR